jgi:hypothetical protein
MRCCETNNDGIVVSCVYRTLVSFFLSWFCFVFAYTITMRVLYPICAHITYECKLTNSILARKVDSIEDFKEACEEINKKEHKKSKGKGRGRKEGEEEDEENDRKGRQPMCCEDSKSSVLGSATNLLGRADLDNKCTDLEG